MPWSSGAEYASKHNKKLHGKSATKAKDMAEAMIADGTDEGIAIATANKYASKQKSSTSKPSTSRRSKNGAVRGLMGGK
jgi:uncharacterized protein YdaT